MITREVQSMKTCNIGEKVSGDLALNRCNQRMSHINSRKIDYKRNQIFIWLPKAQKRDEEIPDFILFLRLSYDHRTIEDDTI